VLNKRKKLNLNHKEKEIYEKAYLNTLNIRRAKYIVGSTIVTGVAVSLIVRQINSGFNMSGGGGGGMPWHGQ